MNNNLGGFYFGNGNTLYVEGGIINGESSMALYDPLRQAAYRPDLRKDKNGLASITLPYADMGIEGFFSEIQMEVTGSASREVAASEFYWAEMNAFESFAFAIKGDNASPSTTKTAQISRYAQTKNGLFAVPVPGWDAIIVGQGSPSGQLVKINNVTKISNGNFTVTLESKNGENIDLSKKGQYTVTMIPMQNQPKGASGKISKRAYAYNPPLLRKSWVQKFNDGIGLHEDEITNYIYDRKWEIVKGVDGNGNGVDYIYIPSITKKLQEAIFASRTLRILMNKRDYGLNEGFDGIIPTVENYGMFNMPYDDLMLGSFRSMLFNIIKSLRKVNGSETNYLLHDFNFGIDWNEAMASLVKLTSNPVNLNYELFGAGGVGDRDLTYYNFMNFSWGNYNFIAKKINTFDTDRYGQILPYFALLMPAKRLQDSHGNAVPIVTMCHVAGAEPAKTQYIRVDDARLRGEFTIDFYAQDTFGIEFHAPSRCGLIYKSGVN